MRGSNRKLCFSEMEIVWKVHTKGMRNKENDYDHNVEVVAVDCASRDMVVQVLIKIKTEKSMDVWTYNWS